MSDGWRMGESLRTLCMGSWACHRHQTHTRAYPSVHICQRDMKTHSINPANWETQVADRSSWRTAIRTCIRTIERRRREQWEGEKEHKKQTTETTAEPGAKTFKCSNCNRVCDSRIGLYSHSRRCSNPDWHNMGAQPIVSRDRRRPTTTSIECDITRVFRHGFHPKKHCKRPFNEGLPPKANAKKTRGHGNF